MTATLYPFPGNTDLLTLAQVSSLYHFSTRTIANFVDDDLLPHRRLNGVLMFSRADLFNWMGEPGLHHRIPPELRPV